MGRPRYTYQDTPKGTWRYDSKTGKRIWRPLGKEFPVTEKPKKKRRKK